MSYKTKAPQRAKMRVEALDLVPLTGLEPVWYFYRGILSPLRLPISPQQQIHNVNIIQLFFTNVNT